MRILHISVTAGTDTTGAIAVDLAKAARDAGHEVCIAYGRGPQMNINGIETVRISSAADYLMHGIATRICDLHAHLTTPANRRLHRLIKSWQPDVVHLHNIHGYYLGLQALAATLKAADIPVIMTVHDLWPMTGHCAVPGACTAYAAGCSGRCPSAKCYPSTMFRSNAPGNLRNKSQAFSAIPNLHLVAPSHYILHSLAQSYLSHKPTTLISNGLDLNRFSPTSQPRSGVLAVARRWTLDKGIDQLIALRHLLSPHIPIYIAGKTPRNKLPYGITSLGLLTPDQMVNAYRTAKVVVIPTRGESFCMTRAEALACDTPVVAYNTGAGADLLTPYSTHTPGQAHHPTLSPEDPGYSITPGDIAAMARAVQYLHDTPRKPDTCRRLAVEHYERSKMHLAYLDLYSKITSATKKN